MNDVVIRDMRPDDVEAIVAIAIAAWAPIYAGYRRILGDELYHAKSPNWQERKAGEIRAACDPNNSAMVCVGEQKGQIIGFITFSADQQTRIGEIGNNAVHPDHQGKGLGQLMYQHVFGRLKELEMRFVTVRTGGDPAHAPARRAYEKAGFSIKLPGVEYYREL